MNSTKTDPAADSLHSVFASSNHSRDLPSLETVEDLRRRFPTEDEYDRLLRRRAENRSRPVPPPASLDAIQSQIESFLRSKITDEFQVRSLRWMSGGGSKIQVAFDLIYHRESGEVVDPLVVRLEPAESLNSTSRQREAQLIRAVEGTLPVPKVRWIDEFGDWFDQPALVYTLMPGVTKPSGVTTHVGGVGAQYSDQLRVKLGSQFVGHLARLHSMDIVGAPDDLSAFNMPSVGSAESALWQVNRARRIWEEDRGEDLPLLDVAANWLGRNLPELDQVSILHGDYRTGNFLFDESGGEITAWLDWERGYLGDRHRDLAWAVLPQWGRFDQSSNELLVCGLIPLSEFVERYTERSGLSIDTERLKFYRILNSYQLVVSSLGTAYRVSRLGRSHQDVLLTWIEGLAFNFAAELQSALESEV